MWTWLGLREEVNSLSSVARWFYLISIEGRLILFSCFLLLLSPFLSVAIDGALLEFLSFPQRPRLSPTVLLVTDVRFLIY